MVRDLNEASSLDANWTEVVFTEARLLGDDNAKDLAPTFTQLRLRLEQVRGGQLDAWREEVVAQAAVSAADDRLDDWVHALDLALSNVLAGDTQSPRYRRYFSLAPSAIIRMALESELGRVRGWADSLATEPEPVLQGLGADLSKIVLQGDAALDQRLKAATARTDHRVRSISSLIDDINGARVSTYGALTKKAAELHLARNWPDRFFMHASRPPKAEPQPVAPNGQTSAPSAPVAR
jgi:hypothetical protein